MPKPNIQPLDLISISKGALAELFEANIAKIAANITDTSTSASVPRTLSIKLKFTPDSDRRGIKIVTTATCGLAAIAEHQSRAYIGRDESGTAYLFGTDPRQDVLFEAPAADENLLNFKTNTSN